MIKSLLFWKNWNLFGDFILLLKSDFILEIFEKSIGIYWSFSIFTFYGKFFEYKIIDKFFEFIRNCRNLVPIVEDAVAFVGRRINELLQIGAGNGDIRRRREHALLLRTISGEISDFLGGLIPLGFSHYGLLPENGFNFSFFFWTSRAWNYCCCVWRVCMGYSRTEILRFAKQI